MRGFRVGAVSAGIKAGGNLDLGLIVGDVPCCAAGCFTTNKIASPTVAINRQNIRSGRAQAVFVNAGNANACTGARGERDVRTICGCIGRQLDIKPEDVLVTSTGIIGKYLPMDKIRSGIGDAVGKLSRSARMSRELAKAIMTTDTRPKQAYQQIRLGGKVVRIAGIAKGSGMIAPNMATMLAYITTDADISAVLLRRGLKDVTDRTFNKVSIDNHISTNDSVIVLASGLAGNRAISKASRNYNLFVGALWQVCDDLARQMAADGEGATRAVTVKLAGAATKRQARHALRAIVDSPLVRTAFNGADPNWGRIISAVGYSGAKFDSDKLACRIAGVTVFRNGRPARFDAVSLSKKMKAKQWSVEVDLAVGRHGDFCYTCDLSHGYISINADYHT